MTDNITECNECGIAVESSPFGDDPELCCKCEMDSLGVEL